MKKLLFFLLPVLFITCSSDEYEQTGKLTKYPVNFQINVNAMDSQLKEQGGYIIRLEPSLSGDKIGNKGLYFYHSTNGIVAFDVCCPHEWDDRLWSFRYAKIENNIIFCNTCQSEFDINTMKAISGKAKEKGFSLVQYKVTPQNTEGVYLITND